MQNEQLSLAIMRQQLAANSPQVIEGNFPEAAVLVAVTVGEGEPEIILTRRAAHMNIHPGEAAFPGGKQDPDDTNLLATAMREAYEEVGLFARDFEYLGALDQRLTRTDIKVSPFVGLVPSTVELSANLQELDVIYTVPLRFFLDPNNLTFFAAPYKGAMVNVPCFNYQQHRVIGVTALMIVDLMNTSFNAGLIV